MAKKTDGLDQKYLDQKDLDAKDLDLDQPEQVEKNADTEKDLAKHPKFAKFKK